MLGLVFPTLSVLALDVEGHPLPLLLDGAGLNLQPAFSINQGAYCQLQPSLVVLVLVIEEEDFLSIFHPLEGPTVLEPFLPPISVLVLGDSSHPEAKFLLFCHHKLHKLGQTLLVPVLPPLSFSGLDFSSLLEADFHPAQTLCYHLSPSISMLSASVLSFPAFSF